MAEVTFTEEEYRAAMDKLNKAREQHYPHHQHICPEFLEELKDDAMRFDWYSIAPGIPGLGAAYNITMHGFRKLLEPIGGWK